MPEFTELEVVSYSLFFQIFPLVDIRLELCRSIHGPDTWAIREGNCCLDKKGSWRIEPLPSNRDERYYRMTRWSTAKLALRFWNKGSHKSRFEGAKGHRYA